MALSDDGGRVAFLAGHNTIYRDGRLLRSYGSRQVGFPLTLSGDGSVLAWQIREDLDRGSRIVVDGIEGPLHSMTGLPVLSADGKVVAYRASEDGDHWRMIVNGVPSGEVYESMTQPAVSRDGRKVAYGAENGRALLHVGAEILELAEPARSVFLSRDGSRWGVVTRTRVVTAEGRGEAFDEIQNPEFSPDGKRIAYAGRRGDRWFMVVDERRLEAPGLIGGPYWSDDGSKVGYGALLGRELWWKAIDAR